MKIETMRTSLAAILLALCTTPGFAASIWDGVFTDAQADHGAAQYQAACSMCHGPALEGNGEAPPLAGRFMPDWGGTTLADLYDKVHDTMPLFAPGTLKPQDTTDIIAFMLRTNGLPAGATALTPGEGLKAITFDVTKPVAKTKRAR